MLRIATRASTLARWQADEVARLLRAAHPGLPVEPVVIETAGDRRLDLPIWEMGGQGVFVKEIQIALLEGRADVAVHSAKDLPSIEGAGLRLAAFPVRADPRDALVGRRLDELAEGATVATGSVRRRAQLAALRPDLVFSSLRGNIATRLGQIPAGGAVVVALAALDRLGQRHLVAEIFDADRLVPQVGQGTIAVECRADDAETTRLLGSIDDAAVRLVTETERAFLARIGGACDLPVGAYARLDGDVEDGSIVLDALVASLDGSETIRDRLVAPARAGSSVGTALAGAVLAAGADRLLARFRPEGET
jgi:hydroxymethylbilane synthase